eukprot:jgi/Botrbrau1/3966/Bobra.0365s0039.1
MNVMCALNTCAHLAPGARLCKTNQAHSCKTIQGTVHHKAIHKARAYEYAPRGGATSAAGQWKVATRGDGYHLRSDIEEATDDYRMSETWD